MTPTYEVPGSPTSITAKAADMRTRGSSFVQVADGLDTINTDGWTSKSADMFREQFQPESGRWRDAGNGFVKAAAALEVYATQLQTAQDKAVWCRQEWDRGEQASVSARSAYDADVARGQREKSAFEAQGGTYTLTILPFDDPGTSIKAGADAAYDTLHGTLDGQAHTCADQVRAGCAGAPESRNWFETALAFAGDVFVGIWEGVEGLAELAMMPITMITDMLDDLTKLATGELTPEELAMKYQLKLEDAQAMLNAFLDDPAGFAKEIGKAILDWDTWSDNPAKAIGHLVPDIVLAIATLGSGTAVSATEKGVTGIAKGAEAMEDVTGVASKLDDVAGATSKLDDVAGATSKLDDVAGATSKLDDVATVYRVEGPGNARIEVGAGGDVTIKGDSMLFLNFGDKARAAEFLEKRLAQGWDQTTLKSFDVAKAYADEVATRAVPERFAKQTGASIIQVDTARTLSSYGLKASEFEQLLQSIISGSAR